jgi:Family of unknown function (DUF6502)
MESASNPQVVSAARQWLKPLIHVLIRCGITWKDFAALAKTTYVEVATRHFGKRGRPTNVSRTAVLTGLARREVRKQRECVATAPEAWTAYVSKASLVLAAWHQDPEMDEQLIRLWGTVIADIATTYVHKHEGAPDDADAIRLGAGVYHIED